MQKGEVVRCLCVLGVETWGRGHMDSMRVSEAAAIIGVAEDCSESELKNAYRALARVHHPDKVEEEKKEDAVVKFQQIGAALEVMGRERVRGGGLRKLCRKSCSGGTHTRTHTLARVRLVTYVSYGSSPHACLGSPRTAPFSSFGASASSHSLGSHTYSSPDFSSSYPRSASSFSPSSR